MTDQQNTQNQPSTEQNLKSSEQSPAPVPASSEQNTPVEKAATSAMSATVSTGSGQHPTDDAPAQNLEESEITKVLRSIDDSFLYYNWNFGDKERLRFQTISNPRYVKFYERFLKEGNQLLNLSIKLATRRVKIKKMEA